jgi:hypothetical protein
MQKVNRALVDLRFSFMNAFCTAKSFLFVCRKANTSHGEAVLHAQSALHCANGATSLKKAGIALPLASFRSYTELLRGVASESRKNSAEFLRLMLEPDSPFSDSRVCFGYDKKRRFELGSLREGAVERTRD